MVLLPLYLMIQVLPPPLGQVVSTLMLGTQGGALCLLRPPFLNQGSLDEKSHLRATAFRLLQHQLTKRLWAKPASGA